MRFEIKIGNQVRLNQPAAAKRKELSKNERPTRHVVFGRLQTE